MNTRRPVLDPGVEPRSQGFQGELWVNSAPCVGPCIQRVLWLEQEEHCLSGKNHVVVALSETVKHVDKIPAIT